METRFFYDLQDKQLCFKLRQKVDTGYGIEAKGKGVFNTADGSLSYRVHAKKMVCTTERLKDASTTPLLLGFGVAAHSNSKRPVLALSAKKHVALLESDRTVLSAKVEADLDHQGSAVRRQAVIKVSHKMPNFTKKQDLKVSAGLDIDWPVNAKNPNPTVLVQVKENNWALHLRHKRWSVTYDL